MTLSQIEHALGTPIETTLGPFYTAQRHAIANLGSLTTSVYSDSLDLPVEEIEIVLEDRNLGWQGCLSLLGLSDEGAQAVSDLALEKDDEGVYFEGYVVRLSAPIWFAGGETVVTYLPDCATLLIQLAQRYATFRAGVKGSIVRALEPRSRRESPKPLHS